MKHARTTLWFLVLGLATVAPALAQTSGGGDADPPAADPPDDPPDPADRANARQLRNIAKAVDREDERLARVLNAVGPPDQPIPDEIRTELIVIRAAAQKIGARVAPYSPAQPPAGGGGAPPPPAGGGGVGPGTSDPGTGPGTAAPARVRDVRHLQNVSRRLGEIDERLARVLNAVGPPDQPVPDEVRTEIAAIATEVRELLAHVAPYLGGTVPPPADG